MAPNVRCAEQARVKASEVGGSDEVRAFAGGIAERLPPSVHEKVSSILVRVAVADNDLCGGEEDVPGAFTWAFEVQAALAEAIHQGTLAVLGKVAA